jgi:hypothetical protein
MGTMPGVNRGRHFAELDLRFGGDPEEFLPVYDLALEALESGRSLSELAGARVAAEDAQHFSEHWLGQWWPEHQPVETVLRAGLVEAIGQARDAELPLQTIVVSGALDAFEVVVIRGRHQVTMLLVTPPPPGTADVPQHGVTVVRRQSGQVVVQRPAEPTAS